MAEISEDRAWKAYLEESRTFDDDRLQRSARSERRAWRVAMAATVCIVLLCGALAGLMPLKTVMPPYIVKVDAQTGEVEVLKDSRSVREMALEEAEQKHWVRQYVEAREGYSWPERAALFHKVSLMSEIDEQNRYAAGVVASNPNAPQRRLGQNGLIDIHIRSITLSGGNTAAVRFRRTVRGSDGRESVSNWIATMNYRFVPPAGTVRESDLQINPRGFTVSNYRLDEEIGR